MSFIKAKKQSIRQGNGKNKLWGKLKGMVKTGLVHPPKNWRKKSPTKLKPQIVQSLLGKIKKGRQRQSKNIRHNKKIERFKQHATGRSNFLSTNATSRLKSKLQEAAKKEKLKREKHRSQRRRSMATGEMMSFAAIAALQKRPPSASLNRNIVQQEHLNNYESSGDDSSSSDEEIIDGYVVKKQRTGKTKDLPDSDKDRPTSPVPTMKDQHMISHESLPTPAAAPHVETRTNKYYQKLSEKRGGLAQDPKAPPGSGLYIAHPLLWGREQMNSFIDDRNKGCLPKFALNSNNMVWMAGCPERRQYKYGFRPLISETARSSSLYDSNHDIIDASCGSELRTLFVTKQRTPHCQGGTLTSSVWFVQGEAQSMKGGSLNKAEVLEITHLAKDIEHVACTTSRMYALSKHGIVYSIAPKPNDDPRYVWETEKNPPAPVPLVPSVPLVPLVPTTATTATTATAAPTTERSTKHEDHTSTAEVKDKHGTTNDSFFIRRMPKLCHKRIVSISAGTNHVVCLNATGRVWSWGSGIALGLGSHVVEVLHPTLVRSIQKERQLRVTQISAGAHHTLCLAYRLKQRKPATTTMTSTSMSVAAATIGNEKNQSHQKPSIPDRQKEQVGLAWGAWDSRLGASRRPTTASLSTCWEPQIMTKLTNLKCSISATDATDANKTNAKDSLVMLKSLHAGGTHSVALDVKGYIWCFGNNDYGQLGVGHINSVWTPKQLRSPCQCVAVGVGQRHTIVVTALGDVWSFGDNSSGSLGLSGGLACRVVPKIVMGGLHGIKVTKVCAGGRVSVLVSQNLHHDTHGKWVSLNNSHRSYDNKDNMDNQNNTDNIDNIDNIDNQNVEKKQVHESKYIHRKRMGKIDIQTKVNRETMDKENNYNYLTTRANQKKGIEKKKGWGRVKTFEKIRLAKEKKAMDLKKKEYLQKKQEQQEIKQKRKLQGLYDSSSEEEEDEVDKEVIAALRKEKTMLEKKTQYTQLQLNQKHLDTQHFIKPSIVLTKRTNQTWMKRAPTWMLTCQEWKDNANANNTINSMHYTSDRELWLMGRIMNEEMVEELKDMKEMAPASSHCELSGRAMRVRQPGKHASVYSVRDAFFKQRQYVKCVVQAQALCRGILTRSDDARIAQLFAEFDVDGGGSIDASEFQKLAFACGEILDNKATAAAIKAIDTDNNGTIELNEFKAWLTGFGSDPLAKNIVMKKLIINRKKQIELQELIEKQKLARRVRRKSIISLPPKVAVVEKKVQVPQFKNLLLKLKENATAEKRAEEKAKKKAEKKALFQQTLKDMKEKEKLAEKTALEKQAEYRL